MWYLHNVSGILTLDINTLTLIERKTSSLLNMWSGFAITKKNIILNNEMSTLDATIYSSDTYLHTVHKTTQRLLNTSDTTPSAEHHRQ